MSSILDLVTRHEKLSKDKKHLDDSISYINFVVSCKPDLAKVKQEELQGHRHQRDQLIQEMEDIKRQLNDRTKGWDIIAILRLGARIADAFVEPNIGFPED